MGSIASVLQWHCEQCSLINPTEQLKCLRCGISKNGENIGWIEEHGDVKENSDPRGACTKISRRQCQRNSEKFFTWTAAQNQAVNNTLKRSSSFSCYIRQWQCEKCQYFNITTSSSCVCGVLVEKDYLKTFKKDHIKLFNMDGGFGEWRSPLTPVENPEVAVDSPKRQVASMLGRMKNKVSRSLSNGSVVHKLFLEASPKNPTFKRPTSLLVDNSSPNCESDVNKNVNEENDLSALYAVVNKGNKKQPIVLETWTCPRCTLENSGHFERCEVCETPKRALGGSTIPKNGVVITVPEWDNTDADLSKQKSPSYKSIRLVHKPLDTPEASKPVYRRCQSQVNTPSPEAKTTLNRRSMIETDLQNNYVLKSPVTNGITCKSRYSYVGVSEANPEKHLSVQNGKELHGSSSPNPKADLDRNWCEARSSQAPTLDVRNAGNRTLGRMWTCIQCSFAYNPIWSETCDICASIRTPPSLTEPSLITVTKDSVRYTPPKEKNREPRATLATAEHDLDDDSDPVKVGHQEAETKWICRKCTLVSFEACSKLNLDRASSWTRPNDRKERNWVVIKSPFGRAVMCRNQKVQRTVTLFQNLNF